MTHYILAIDQGTTSTRAIIFDEKSHIIALHQVEFTQYFPQPGWVEHDGEEIWRSVVTCIQQVLIKANLTAAEITAIGISNQRETTLVWDKQSGELLHRAIVWQDRRTADLCQQFIANNMDATIQAKTGLLIDPYFSATKVAWLLDNVPHLRTRANKNEILVGTIDSFLIWRLTAGKAHLTDATNASRTMLYNINKHCWDQALLDLFKIPANILPKVCDSNAKFGVTDQKLFGAAIPILGVAGDQQAATIGQACFTPGMIKSTYGTGCFVLLNTGDTPVFSKNRLLTTIAYQINGKAIYGLEGSIFIAGAAIQWLRDALHLIAKASETEALVNQTHNNSGVYLVPAFTGLGAPFWDPLARGAIFGLTRDTGVKEIVRAALEAVCYQTRDLLTAMQQDGIARVTNIRVDGGMAINDWVMQFLADILGIEITRPRINETSSLGVAYLAGLSAGVYDSLQTIAQLWQCEKNFTPTMSSQDAKKLYEGWLEAVAKICHDSDH